MKIDINKLNPDLQNVKIHNQKSIDGIKKSLIEFGQYKPIVVQKSSNKILAGNGTYQAIKELDWTEIDVTYIDVNDKEAIILATVDNQSSELSEWDEQQLTEDLYGFDHEMQEISGFFSEEIDELFNRIEDFDVGDRTEKANIDDVCCPHCQHKFKNNK